MALGAVIGAAGSIAGGLLGSRGSRSSQRQRAPAWWQEPAKGIAENVSDLQGQPTFAQPGTGWSAGLRGGQDVAQGWGQGFGGMDASPLWGQAQENLANTMGGAWLNQNPHLQGAIEAAQRPVVESFQEQIMPQLRSQAQASGAFGGARQGLVENQAARDTQRVLGEISATMTADDYARERAAMERAEQFAPQLGASMMQAQMMGPESQMNLALQDQMMRQAQLDAPIQRQQELAGILAALQPGHQTSGTTGGGALGAIQGALGGAQLGGQMAGLFGGGTAPSLLSPGVSQSNTPWAMSLMPWN